MIKFIFTDRHFYTGPGGMTVCKLTLIVNDDELGFNRQYTTTQKTKPCGGDTYNKTTGERVAEAKARRHLMALANRDFIQFTNDILSICRPLTNAARRIHRVFTHEGMRLIELKKGKK